jgi:hypothetical protein
MALSNSSSSSSMPAAVPAAPRPARKACSRAHADQPLEQAAHRQQPPAVVARHAVGLRAGHRGQLQRQPVQRRQHLR